VERGLEYAHSGPAHTAAYLEAPLLAALGPLASQTLLDIGCGNGAVAASLAARRAGFAELSFVEGGRLPWLWKSIVVSARRP
jgi:tRNA1(Val) A37 N6-methylase TrmN6